MTLASGDRAPAFALPDADGRTVRLSSFRGQRVLLYAYPAAITGQGMTIVGISPDSPEKLAAFRDRDALPFTLLSDPDHAVLEAYGAWGEKKNYGRTYLGVIRSTFVISPTGKVEYVFSNVKATGHVAKLIRDLSLA
jgi:peroxiredoxin Q/BCP